MVFWCRSPSSKIQLFKDQHSEKSLKISFLFHNSKMGLFMTQVEVYTKQTNKITLNLLVV